MSVDPATLRALAFDVFGTVVDWRGSIAREAEAFFAARGRRIDGFAFAAFWRSRYQPAMERVRAGKRGFVKLDVLHRENLIETLAEYGAGGLGDAEIDELNRAWHRLDPWPDVVPGLTRLKRKFVLATLSNGNVALMVNMAKRAGLPWDAILGAEVARAYKPMPECYLTAADMLGLAPAQCLMVAAHNDDLKAAARVGFKTAFVPRPREYGDKTWDLVADPAVDIAAADFEDLATRLGA